MLAAAEPGGFVWVRQLMLLTEILKTTEPLDLGDKRVG